MHAGWFANPFWKDANVDRTYHDLQEKKRCCNERYTTEEHLRTVLDHKGGIATPAPGLGDHRTGSEQAHDPSKDLYDYAQTKAATMNYVKSLAKQLAPAASA